MCYCLLKKMLNNDGSHVKIQELLKHAEKCEYLAVFSVFSFFLAVFSVFSFIQRSQYSYWQKVTH